MNVENENFTRWTVALCFLCGAVGGAAPSLLELASKARAEQLPSGGYFIAMAIFAFLGGFLALVYREKITHKAFLLGVSAPALIVAGGKAVDGGSAWRLDPGLTKVAYAQENTLSSSPKALPAAESIAADRLIVVTLDKAGFAEKPAETHFQAMVQTPRGLLKLVLNPITDAAASPNESSDRWPIGSLRIPIETESVVLEGFSVTRRADGSRETEAIRSNQAVLPSGREALTIVLHRRTPFWSGFFEALGMQNQARRQIEFPLTFE